MADTYMTSGNYDRYCAIVEAHFDREREAGYNSVIEEYGGIVPEPEELEDHIETLRYERKMCDCDGKKQAYDELIESLNKPTNESN